MVPRVYLETSIITFFDTPRSCPESVARRNWTRQWWSQCDRRFELVSSVLVVEELQRISNVRHGDTWDLLRQVELLPVSSEVADVARVYLSRKALAEPTTADAMHLALAAVHGIDIVLTWACRRLAHPVYLNQLRVINYELGLSTPVVLTPLSFIDGDCADDGR